MATNIKASFVSATGTIDSSSGRIRGYSFVNNSTSIKEVILRDGGASGDTVLKVQLNSGGATDQYIEDAWYSLRNKFTYNCTYKCGWHSLYWLDVWLLVKRKKVWA